LLKTPNLARNKDSETATGESTVYDKGDEDIEGKEEDISVENRIDLEGEEEELVECTAECCNYPRDS